MNAKTVRLKKEARALFWPWCIVMFALALPIFPQYWFRGEAPIALFGGTLLLATLSFGHEFHYRTLSLLLSQPVSRMMIWREKLSVTVVALLPAIALFCYDWRSQLQHHPREWVFVGAAIITMMASATVCTLFAGSITGGFFLNVFPFAVVVVTENWERILGPHPSRARTITALWTFAIAALGYAGLLFWLGGRKLARFQVTGGMAADDLLTAGPNVMPEALARWFRYRPTEPFFNLIRKELRLLQGVWLIALPAVVYMIFLTVLRLLPDHAHVTFHDKDVFVLSPLIGMPLMAILAGCLSVGEERTWETHSWHLTLPVSARRQWLIKLLMAVFMGIFCAVLLPDLVLLVGGNLSFGGPAWVADPRAAFDWMYIVPVLTLAAFWCACAFQGTVRAALWVFPVTMLILFAARFGGLMGQKLALITGTLRDFVVSWFELSPLAFTSSQFTGLIWLWSLVPVLLLAVIQSYWLFRSQPQDSILGIIRRLMPVTLAAFLCGFSVSAGLKAMWQPFSETQEAIEKLHAGGATAQITVEELAKVSPLSPPTRRWLRDSSISVAPDKARSGYFATIHLAGGLDCRLAVGHFRGRSFNSQQPSCAQKSP